MTVRVELAGGYRGNGLSFNGKSSHINTSVPLAAVKTVAFWLNPRNLDEPFFLLNFHASKTGFSVWSEGDGKTLLLSWFANDKWQGVIGRSASHNPIDGIAILLPPDPLP